MFQRTSFYHGRKTFPDLGSVQRPLSLSKDREEKEKGAWKGCRKKGIERKDRKKEKEERGRKQRKEEIKGKREMMERRRKCGDF